MTGTRIRCAIAEEEIVYRFLAQRQVRLHEVTLSAELLVRLPYDVSEQHDDESVMAALRKKLDKLIPADWSVTPCTPRIGRVKDGERVFRASGRVPLLGWTIGAESLEVR